VRPHIAWPRLPCCYRRMRPILPVERCQEVRPVAHSWPAIHSMRQPDKALHEGTCSEHAGKDEPYPSNPKLRVPSCCISRRCCSAPKLAACSQTILMRATQCSLFILDGLLKGAFSTSHQRGLLCGWSYTCKPKPKQTSSAWKSSLSSGWPSCCQSTCKLASLDLPRALS
jgi:hypothetical protein